MCWINHLSALTKVDVCVLLWFFLFPFNSPLFLMPCFQVPLLFSCPWKRPVLHVKQWAVGVRREERRGCMGERTCCYEHCACIAEAVQPPIDLWLLRQHRYVAGAPHVTHCLTSIPSQPPSTTHTPSFFFLLKQGVRGKTRNGLPSSWTVPFSCYGMCCCYSPLVLSKEMRVRAEWERTVVPASVFVFYGLFCLESYYCLCFAFCSIQIGKNDLFDESIAGIC